MYIPAVNILEEPICSQTYFNIYDYTFIAVAAYIRKLSTLPIIQSICSSKFQICTGTYILRSKKDKTRGIAHT